MKKTFKVLMSLLLVSSLFLMTGCEKEKEVVEEVEPLKIELNGNPTTGYVWTCINDDMIEVNEEYVSDNTDKNLDGIGGKYIYTIKGLQSGESAFECTYARSWENTEFDKTAVFYLTIDEKLKVTEKSHDGNYFENIEE